MQTNRRNFLKASLGASVFAAADPASAAEEKTGSSTSSFPLQNTPPGSQRLSLEQLQKWGNLAYGMFLHFGMSTFTGKEIPDGKDPLSTYAPDKLDVDQWISVARDAGMTYAILTSKHVAGHCLWPSKHTDYTVANSPDKTDVIEKFVTACRAKGILPGFYYCSWDNHNRFGSKTPSDGGEWAGMNSFPKTQIANLPPYTTSLYHHFQTAQIIELLDTYGPWMEVWIDIPGVLGRGYRTFLYDLIARKHPDAVIMMNTGIGDGSTFPVDYAWPSDLIAIERKMPVPAGYNKWHTIEGKSYYIPGEICDPIGKEWFYVTGDLPRSDEDLRNQYQSARQRGVNLLLDVPPDKHGLIPDEFIHALNRLRKNARIGL